MTYTGDIFHNHDKQSNTALNSIAERQRYPANMADKQSSFPELNAALRHILILYSLTSLLKHQPADAMDITAAVNQQTAASLKNQRLALEMANRPSVLAALNNTSNINNQLCKVSVKARLGHPMVRVGMMGLRGQMRGGGGGGSRRRGLVKGFYTRRSISSLHGVVSSLGVQKGWGQQQCGGNVIWTGPMGSRGGGAITKTGGGSFMSVSKAYSGCSRARFDSHQIPSREQLDEQLDDYMSMSKSHLDAELDPYMAQVDLDDIV